MKSETKTMIRKSLACVTRHQRVCSGRLRTVVLNWDDFAPQGQLACLETFEIVLTAGGGGAASAKLLTKHPTMKTY